jgi:peptidoglycan/xylan/chitin deacetylase (PgdA/CDA1 family)
MGASFFSSPVPVLTYHRVLPYKSALSVTLDEFEHHLHWLKDKGFHTLSSQEFQQALTGEKEVERGLIITFDDGYRDNWYLAAPLLQKYGMNALIFVITGSIKECKERPIRGGWLEEGDERFLSWREISAMVDSGIFEVHSHTHSHNSSWLHNPSEETRLLVHQDIATSVQTLRDRGYTNETHLAWPWGYFRKKWLEDLSAVGVRYSYTMRPGTNYPCCDTKMIKRLNGERRLANLEILCSLGSSRIHGRMLNVASNIWSAALYRP